MALDSMQEIFDKIQAGTSPSGRWCGTRTWRSGR